MLQQDRELLIAIARAIAHLPPGNRVELLSKAYACEELQKTIKYGVAKKGKARS
jgi:hypothetical protein